MSPWKYSGRTSLTAVGRGLVASVGIVALLGAAVGVAADAGASPLGTVTNSVYVSLTPSRVLDTRSGNGLTGRLAANSPRTLQVTNRFPADSSVNVPSGATAIVGTLTVTEPTAQGFVSVTLVPITSPKTSSVNFLKGQTIANAVTATLGAGGTVSLTYGASTSGSTAQVILDVTGYFAPGGSGATGAKGDNGSAGPAGAPGAQGDKGSAGLDGAPGAQGPAGVANYRAGHVEMDDPTATNGCPTGTSTCAVSFTTDLPDDQYSVSLTLRGNFEDLSSSHDGVILTADQKTNLGFTIHMYDGVGTQLAHQYGVDWIAIPFNNP